MPRPSTLPGPAKGGVSADALQLALAAVAPPCDQAVKCKYLRRRCHFTLDADILPFQRLNGTASRLGRGLGCLTNGKVSVSRFTHENKLSELFRGCRVLRPIAASYTSGVPGGLVVVHYTRRSAELAFESARAQGAVKVVLSDGQAVIV